MCQISNSIKLCTCKATSTERLQHYWALHRRNKDKNEVIVGEVILPYEWAEPNYKLIYEDLEQRINYNDIFDVPLILKTSDLLEIVFNNNDDFKRVVYGFKYSKSQWIKHDLNHFYLMGYCDIVQFGKIKK